MKSGIIANVLSAAVLLAAGLASASAQTSSSAPSVSRPSSSAVSPNLSDLPTAHWAQGQNLKLVPPPKPLPPRNAGPGGASSEAKALHKKERPPLRAHATTAFCRRGPNR